MAWELETICIIINCVHVYVCMYAQHINMHTHICVCLYGCTVWFSSVHSLSSVQLFVTSWTAEHQASLSFTISQSLCKLMSIESVMLPQPSYPLLSLLFLNLSQHQGLFQWVSPLYVLLIYCYWSTLYNLNLEYKLRDMRLL